jgi:hypothetical protein
MDDRDGAAKAGRGLHEACCGAGMKARRIDKDKSHLTH